MPSRLAGNQAARYRGLAVSAALPVVLLIQLGCRKAEAPLGRIDEVVALPLARTAWVEAKLLALKMNTVEGPKSIWLGLRRDIADIFRDDPDAKSLSTICEVWGPIWAQITWGPMTNRVYENKKELLPCSYYQARSDVERRIKLIEELSGYKLGDKPAGK